MEVKPPKTYTDNDLEEYKLLFNPRKTEDLISFGVPKEIVDDCILRCIEKIKEYQDYRPFDVTALIKEGFLNIKPGTPITCNIEYKKSVTYVRIGQINENKIEGVGRLFYMTNCNGNPPIDWVMDHISEGQFDGSISGFGRYFEHSKYFNAGWYNKGIFNGYVID